MFFPEVVLDKVTITGVKAGTAELSIALTNGGVWTCPVTVTSSDIAVEGITVTPKTAELNVGGTTVLSAVTGTGHCRCYRDLLQLEGGCGPGKR